MFDQTMTRAGALLWRAAIRQALLDLARERGDERELTREWLHSTFARFGALDATALLARWIDRNDLAAGERLRAMVAPERAGEWYRGAESDYEPPAVVLVRAERPKPERAKPAKPVKSAKPAKPVKPVKSAKPVKSPKRPAPPINVEQQNKRAAAILAKRDRAKKLTRQRVGEERARRWRRMTPEERAARRARMSEAQRLSWAKLDDGGRAARVAAIAAGRERKRIARLERVAALRAEAMAAFSVRNAKVAPQSAPDNFAR